MRFVLAIVAVPLLVSAAPPARPPLPTANSPSAANPITDRVCATTTPRLADAQTFIGPAADVSFDLHQAVVRSVDGCIVPAILRRDVDGPSRGGQVPRGETRGLLRPL